MIIRKTVRKYNDIEHTDYSVQTIECRKGVNIPYKKKFKNISNLLRDVFTIQGNFYEYLGISLKDAENMGWHPKDISFSVTCRGWERFLKDKGKVNKTYEKDIKDILFK